jgi:hypothetical protein
MVAVLLAAVRAALAADVAPPPGITDPAQADADFAFVGEYAGLCQVLPGEPERLGVQVTLLKYEEPGKFRAAGYVGGLPGEGGGSHFNLAGIGQTQGKAVEFAEFKYAPNSDRRYRDFRGSARLVDGKLLVLDPEGKQLGELARVIRTSPTAGAKPPAGAIVLFDGTSADQFQRATMTPDGLLVAGCKSKQSFSKDLQLHVEFRVPYRCLRGHGNSGVYLQDIYEIQIFDSLAINPGESQCGGLYVMRRPDLCLSFPPLAWQTFDVYYRVARFGPEQAVVELPRITVFHNGYRIHADVELKPSKQLSPAGGPLHLQAHGSPVHFRNVWLVEREYAPPRDAVLTAEHVTSTGNGR